MNKSVFEKGLLRSMSSNIQAMHAKEKHKLKRSHRFVDREKTTDLREFNIDLLDPSIIFS